MPGSLPLSRVSTAPRRSAFAGHHIAHAAQQMATGSGVHAGPRSLPRSRSLAALDGAVDIFGIAIGDLCPSLAATRDLRCRSSAPEDWVVPGPCRRSTGSFSLQPLLTFPHHNDGWADLPCSASAKNAAQRRRRCPAPRPSQWQALARATKSGLMPSTPTRAISRLSISS